MCKSASRKANKDRGRITPIRPSRKRGKHTTKRPKEFLYVGHYIDRDGNFILKVGTTNDLDRRRKEHNRNYKKSPNYTMPPGGEFVYDFSLPLSKYNTLRYEDKTRQRWQDEGIGEFVRNDRFYCKKKPKTVKVTIRKTYEIPLD